MVSSVRFGLGSLALPGSFPWCNPPNTCTSEDLRRRSPDCPHLGRGLAQRRTGTGSSSFLSDGAQDLHDLRSETRAAWDCKVAAQFSASVEIPPACSTLLRSDSSRPL